MENRSRESGSRSSEAPNDITAWDTEYVPQRDALEIFNAAIRISSLPWSNDFKSTSEFSARIETRNHRLGALTRVRVSPHTSVRTHAEISASYEDSVFATLVLGGAIEVEQGGHRKTGSRGDIHLFRGDIPASVTMDPTSPHRVVVMRISAEAAKAAFKDEARYTNFVITSDAMPKPLQACASFLSENFLRASREEVDSIVQAVSALMPLATNAPMTPEEEESKSRNDHLLGKLHQYIEQNLSDPDLSPAKAAEHFGLSRRYIHKILASRGQTFTACVQTKRLNQIRHELAGCSGRRQAISSLAYQWGFHNLSTFNRAFKRQFGCSPSRYRLGE
mgnify:CR=1 FL=1